MAQDNTWNQKASAAILSIFLHTILLVFLFFYVLKTPLPPYGGGQGVVLNLGYVDEGTGEVQTFNEPNVSKTMVENQPPKDPPSPNENSDPIQTYPSDNAQSEDLLVSEEETGVQSEKKEKQEPIDKAKENVKPINAVENPKPNTETAESEKNKKINPKALFGTSGTETNGGNNNGDNANKVGDQGDPRGDINAKALYGNAGVGGEGGGGSGGGATLDLSGWKWLKVPRVKDDDDTENGKLVFEITIDDEGEIISIKTLEKTVGPHIERLYKQEVEKLSFIRTSASKSMGNSTGKITFIIRSH